MSGLLSSFAISVAANIVTSLFSKNNTEKEIRTAFQDAIEKWCPNRGRCGEYACGIADDRVLP